MAMRRLALVLVSLVCWGRGRRVLHPYGIKGSGIVDMPSRSRYLDEAETKGAKQNDLHALAMLVSSIPPAAAFAAVSSSHGHYDGHYQHHRPPPSQGAPPSQDVSSSLPSEISRKEDENRAKIEVMEAEMSEQQRALEEQEKRLSRLEEDFQAAKDEAALAAENVRHMEDLLSRHEKDLQRAKEEASRTAEELKSMDAFISGASVSRHEKDLQAAKEEASRTAEKEEAPRTAEEVKSMDAMTRPKGPSPPVARRQEQKVYFGKVDGENRGPNPMDPAIELVDDYLWMDDNEETHRLIEEENRYTEVRTHHLNSLADTLSRAYRGVSGAQSYSGVQLDTPNPSGKYVARSRDDSGHEVYNILIRSTSTGKHLNEEITQTTATVAWIDDHTFFYVKIDVDTDDTSLKVRGYQVWRHVLFTEQDKDVLVYEELDPEFHVGCWVSRDRSLLFISSRSHATIEMHFIPTATPAASPTLIRRRQHGVLYEVDSHIPSRSLFLVSNVDGKMNGELFVASFSSPSNWRPVVAAGSQVLAHSDSRSLENIEAFSSFLAVTGREHGFTQLWMVPLATSSVETGPWVEATLDAHCMEVEAGPFELRFAPEKNKLFDSDGKLRVVYQTMIKPPALLEYDVTSRKNQTLQREEFPSSLYKSSRIEVIARDGVAIPVTLMWRPDRVGDKMRSGGGGVPCHILGYGSYGMALEPWFHYRHAAFADRGVVFVRAHVRGGSEMGRHKWYEAQGKLLNKLNTFNDFVDVAQGLLERGIAKPGALSCEGHSAGGLLIGNIVNMVPELFVAALANVPYVDFKPLDRIHWQEYGNPNEAKYHDYIMSYSPINNVRTGKTYPSMLIGAAINDARCPFWGAAKWAQVLRSRIANGDDILCRIISGGHVVAPEHTAFRDAWLLDKLNCTTEEVAA